MLTLLLACAYDENLPQVDVHGSVRLPLAAAATGEVDDSGNPIYDPRMIGPVFLGVFSGITTDAFEYPYPSTGPVFSTDLPPNTYPYGGGTVGRFDFACYEELVCRVSTGRFKDYADVLDFFANVVDDPVTHQGVEVSSPDYFRSYCYDLFEFTADYEMAWVSDADGDGEGERLDFVQEGDEWVAEFDMYHVDYHKGMRIWGWVDSPNMESEPPFSFSTCDPDRGQQNAEYNNNFTYGANYVDVLNYPEKYVSAGDYVPSNGYEFEQADANEFREAAEGLDINVNLDLLVE